MSANDKAQNTAETAHGKAKEVVGRALHDQGIELEGKIEQVVGHLKQAGEKLKDALRTRSNRRRSRLLSPGPFSESRAPAPPSTVRAARV